MKRAEPYIVPLGGGGEEGGMMQFDPAKSPGAGNVSYIASQRTGGSEGAGPGAGPQGGGGMASMPMNMNSPGPYDPYNNNNRASGMAGAGYGHQNQNSFDGGAMMRNRDVGNAAGGGGGYAPSEPASDTNEREFVGPLPPNSPSPMGSGTTYYNNNRDDPRTSTYTEGGQGGAYQAYQQQQNLKNPGSRRTESDVREIAKEVAELLLPQLRASGHAGVNSNSMTPGPPVNNAASNPARQLPQPSDNLSSGVQPPEQPRSPGPPQYERWNP